MFRLERIRADLATGQPELQARAIQQLLRWAKDDPARGAQALPLLRETLVSARDAWTIISAARGIEACGGLEEARRAWRMLLADPREAVVRYAAQVIRDRELVPDLLAALQARPEVATRQAIIHALGRSREPAALEALAGQLADRDVRPHAADALGVLGDGRAIARLEPLLEDHGAAWQEDNHGPMLRVCDVVAEAISRLSGRAVVVPGSPYASPRPVAPGADLWSRPSSTTPAVAAPRGAALKPLAALGSPALLAWLPLCAAMLELPWFAFIVLGMLFAAGKIPRERDAVRLLDLLAAMPVLAGLVGGAVLLARRSFSGRQRIVLGVGLALCALGTLPFAREFFQ